MQQWGAIPSDWRKHVKPRIYATITFAVIAIATALAISNGVVTAQGEPAAERSLDGVWLVAFTPRNCTTGDPIPNAAFEARPCQSAISASSGQCARERESERSR